MKYITNFRLFNEDTEEIFTYLTQNLQLNPNVDRNIAYIIANSPPSEHLSLLLDSCLELCRPYIWHSAFLQTRLLPLPENYITDYNRLISPLRNNMLESEYKWIDSIDLTSSYYQSLKDHIAISFYYSWQLQNKGPQSLYKAITMSKDYNSPLAKTKTYLALKNRQALALADQCSSKYKALYEFLSDSVDSYKNEFGETKYKFCPALTDNALILALIGKRLSNPYADKYKEQDYPYQTFVNLITSFTNIYFDKTAATTRGYNLTPETKLVFDNYLTERLLHFDLINYLLQKYENFKHPNNVLKEGIFKTLIELSTLPNVFSRISMAETLYSTCMDILYTNKNPVPLIRDWQTQTRTLVKFVTQCTVPVLNLAFQYIMEYYLSGRTKKATTKTSKNSPQKTSKKPKKDTSINIYDMFEPYMNHFSSKQDVCNIYSNIDNPACEHKKSAKETSLIVTSRHAFAPHKKLSYSTEKYFSQLAQYIFFSIMTPASFDNFTINYHIPFNEQNIRQIHLSTINHFIEKSRDDALAGIVRV